MLTREREIQSVDEIEIGTHGLIVEQGTTGLLAAQVPIEHGWESRHVSRPHLSQSVYADAWRGRAYLRLRGPRIRRTAPYLTFAFTFDL